jgi:uncharacterized membrane protein YadS
MICIYLLLYVQISKDEKNALKDIEKTEVRTPLIVLPFLLLLLINSFHLVRRTKLSFL